MKYLPLEIANNLMEYWSLILLAQYICSAHMDLRRRNVLLCFCINIIGTALATLFPTDYSLVACTGLELLLTILLFSKKRPSDLLRFLAAFALWYALMLTPLLFLDILMPQILVPIFPDHSCTWFGLITDILLLAALLFLGHILRRYQVILHFRMGEILGSVALGLFAFIDVGLILFLYHANVPPLTHYFFLVVFLGAFIFSTGYFVYSVITARMRVYREALSRSQTEYLQLQMEALHDTKEQTEQAQRMRHDLASHMTMLQTLCQEGSYEEVRKYVERLSQDTIPLAGGILTGNKVADLVVRAKMKVCEGHGITFTFQGSLSGFDTLEAPDICGLLSNAYDNAIEACLSQENAYIHTKVSTTRNYTVVQIVNSIEKKVSLHGNHAGTTKTDKKSHGYGIDIMKRIAYKYNGNCTLHCDGQEFSVKIVVLT